MGEARRALQPTSTVYHHTSTLRTNLIWMSGVIDVEGRSPGALHPIMGEVITDVTARRPCRDFPPLAWFTSDIRIPPCLLATKLMGQPREGGAVKDLGAIVGGDQQMLVNGMALNRVALGFPLAGSTIIPWKDHAGYATSEGRDLNETAREQGDDPNHWYVSDAPVDVLTASEIWTSGSIFNPKLERTQAYLKEVHRMVRLCRETPGAYIPPTWFGDSTVQEMIRRAGRSQIVQQQIAQQAQGIAGAT